MFWSVKQLVWISSVLEHATLVRISSVPEQVTFGKYHQCLRACNSGKDQNCLEYAYLVRINSVSDCAIIGKDQRYSRA